MNAIPETLFNILSWAWLFRIADSISPSGTPRIHLRIRNSKCTYVSGTTSWARVQIEELLADRQIRTAVVKQLKEGKFVFSRNVPDDVRQRIRNLLVSGR